MHSPWVTSRLLVLVVEKCRKVKEKVKLASFDSV